MILIRGIRLDVGGDEKSLPVLAAKALRVDPREIRELKIVRKSLDARKKSSIQWLYSVAITLSGEEKRVLARAKNKNAELYAPYRYEIPSVDSPERPVIAGFGPAGMLAALVLAEAGLRPIVLERGLDVDSRRESVEKFWQSGQLDPESNVQFGEGGAGTFSDGKLNTGTHDKRTAWVLEQFCRFGAPENICYDAKPHVGTDILANVVRNLREHVISLGGEIRFRSRLVGLEQAENRLTGVRVKSGEEEYVLPCSQLILAVGHSARDTFELLCGMGIPMEAKPFSMGVRIEHLQTRVGESQYGEAHTRLPPADYKLNCRLPDGSSAYTFCMCPGGYVVASSSEVGGIVTNGMSYSDRGGENANAALLVTLTPEDFPGEDVLAGMRWQREVEKKCYDYGGGNYLAPAQTVGDFLSGTASAQGGKVKPSYRPGVVWGELREVLPRKITDTMAQAIPELAKRLSCFDDPEAVLTAPESRSSSPVRILRGERHCSIGLEGLYPCGEGAGYAGGITSAAVDGVRCAEAVMEKLREKGEG